MEKLNMKTLSFPAKRLTQALAMLGTVLVLAACGDKGGGGGGGTVVVPPSGCITCGGITSPIILTTIESGNFDDSVVFRDVQVFGESSLIYPNGPYGVIWKDYVGPVAIQGTLDVRGTFTDSSAACVVPAGIYTVQSNSAGQILARLGSGFSVPSVVTVAGPVSLELSIQSPGGYGLYSLSGRVRANSYVSVIRANGVQCAQNAVLFD